MVSLFLDSDVVISSIISSKGASYQLINTSPHKKTISSYSIKELYLVIERLNLHKTHLDTLVSPNNKIKVEKISLQMTVIKKKYSVYVRDINDAHIVAGASLSKSCFLITYNIRHFNIDIIKKDFNIIIMTPGQFLQYMRSKE
jgi:predicted nucleic acid-binding protein